MKPNGIEIHFIKGQFNGQIWTYQNLSHDDIKYHYERLSVITLRESVIYAWYKGIRYFISDYFEIIRNENKNKELSF